jgi:hypothetical protein
LVVEQSEKLGIKVFDIMQGKKFSHMKENALLCYDEISLGYHNKNPKFFGQLLNIIHVQF